MSAIMIGAEEARQIWVQQERIRAWRQQESRRCNIKTQHCACSLSTEYLEAELDDARMGECEDEASDELVGRVNGELEEGEGGVYGKRERRKA
jgi:hypothetical protein